MCLEEHAGQQGPARLRCAQVGAVQEKMRDECATLVTRKSAASRVHPLKRRVARLLDDLVEDAAGGLGVQRL